MIQYQSYPATLQVKFTCSVCGKKNRSHTFRSECTYNPFNLKEDGTQRTPSEVQQQSRDDVQLAKDRFMTEPVCNSCTRALSIREKKELRVRRRRAHEKATAL